MWQDEHSFVSHFFVFYIRIVLQVLFVDGRYLSYYLTHDSFVIYFVISFRLFSVYISMLLCHYWG